MGHGNIEGRFSEFNEKNVAEAQENAGHAQNVHGIGGHDFPDIETAAGQIETQGCHEKHGLIGHGLHQLPFRPHLAVGRVSGIGGNDEAHTGHGQGEDHQQNVAPCKEEGAGQKDEEKETKYIESLRLIDGYGLLVPKFSEIVERLQQRRPHPPLHAGGNLAIQTGKEAPQTRRQQQIQQGADDIDHIIRHGTHLLLPVTAP